MGDKLPLVDADRLRPWLDAQGIEPGAPLAVIRITTGHSNEVFLVGRGERRLVLRRPPRTPLSPTAHDMAREYRLLSAFVEHGAAVPVAQPVALCTDPEVIGAPFYLMERLDGVVVREALPDAFAADEGAPRALADALVDLIAATHAFDWRAGGLEGFGRPDGYLDRQVPRWLGQLERYKTRDIPDADEAGRWLAAHTPPMQDPTVIHGDYKLDNVMFAADLPVRPVAVLDWEQATIGDPLVDLGWLLGLWLDDGEEAQLFGGANVALFGHGPVPSRAELADRYAAVTGRDLTHLAFYCVLGLFKLACVMEGSYARFTAGTSDDAAFAFLEAGVPGLARRALEFT
ncbi:MAG: phosphotransferase family protein [Acidimicrobiia bacterium]